MKIFYLNRTEDESGISGTGRVAQGFVFDNGRVAVTCLITQVLLFTILSARFMLFTDMAAKPRW